MVKTFRLPKGIQDCKKAFEPIVLKGLFQETDGAFVEIFHTFYWWAAFCRFSEPLSLASYGLDDTDTWHTFFFK
jgi:hypothetical protein